MDDAPAPADPPSTPETPTQRVTYGAEDIRYKNPKRTDRTPSTCTSTSSSEGSWTPSYTRGRGRSPFVRGGGRGRTSPSPTNHKITNHKSQIKSQSDDEVSINLFTNKKLRPLGKPKQKNLSSIFSIILFIIGRITNNQRTLNRKEKNLVQSITNN